MVDFKIEITKDRVRVSTATDGWPPKPGTVGSSAACLGMAAVFVYPILPPVHEWHAPRSWPLLLLAPIAIVRLLWEAFRNLFPSGESLTCDSSGLIVGRIPRSSLHGRWVYESFANSAVKEMSFGAVERSPYGTITGLRFMVDGKRKKILAGLESPEAAEVLDALASLGVSVTRDPGMPMLVEMALSRRKRWAGLL